jgi:hypothetical protein
VAPVEIMMSGLTINNRELDRISLESTRVAGASREPEASSGRPPYEDLQIAVLDQLQLIVERLAAVELAISNLRECGGPKIVKELFTPEEFGKLPGVDKEKYTVREWCRLGRINAHKSEAGRGQDGEWRISMAEYERYLNEGLLPDPNKRRDRGDRHGTLSRPRERA